VYIFFQESGVCPSDIRPGKTLDVSHLESDTLDATHPEVFSDVYPNIYGTDMYIYPRDRYICPSDIFPGKKTLDVSHPESDTTSF